MLFVKLSRVYRRQVLFLQLDSNQANKDKNFFFQFLFYLLLLYNVFGSAVVVDLIFYLMKTSARGQFEKTQNISVYLPFLNKTGFSTSCGLDFTLHYLNMVYVVC